MSSHDQSASDDGLITAPQIQRKILYFLRHSEQKELPHKPKLIEN